MVDKDKRSQAAVEIHRFLDGTTTNFDFEERLPFNRSDRALNAISNMLWFCYDDPREHRLVGEHALSPEEKAVFERCVLFLQTNIEYTGPTSFITRETAAPEDATTLLQRFWYSLTGRKLPDPTLVSWNPSTWPFESEEQLRQHQASLKA